MIGHYLSNTNKNPTVSLVQKNLELNKALIRKQGHGLSKWTKDNGA
jgi:hypothetical protein